MTQQRHSSRDVFFAEQVGQPYMVSLRDFLAEEKKTQTIYPPFGSVFRAFGLTSRDDLRVVILGQDPYHGPGQAHGLAFSVQDGVRIPPSLRNIYQELADDVGCDVPVSGDLSKRAEQGVLLLNTTLTVRAGEPMSHRGQGREDFTDAVIRHISDEKEGMVFVLRGGHAKSKAKLIDSAKHHVLTSSHPSPLSAYRGFLGSRPFGQINDFLQAQKKNQIDWSL